MTLTLTWMDSNTQNSHHRWHDWHDSQTDHSHPSVDKNFDAYILLRLLLLLLRGAAMSGWVLGNCRGESYLCGRSSELGQIK